MPDAHFVPCHNTICNSKRLASTDRGLFRSIRYMKYYAVVTTIIKKFHEGAFFLFFVSFFFLLRQGLTVSPWWLQY